MSHENRDTKPYRHTEALPPPVNIGKRSSSPSNLALPADKAPRSSPRQLDVKQSSQATANKQLKSVKPRTPRTKLRLQSWGTTSMSGYVASLEKGNTPTNLLACSPWGNGSFDSPGLKTPSCSAVSQSSPLPSAHAPSPTTKTNNRASQPPGQDMHPGRLYRSSRALVSPWGNRSFDSLLLQTPSHSALMSERSLPRPAPLPLSVAKAGGHASTRLPTSQIFVEEGNPRSLHRVSSPNLTGNLNQWNDRSLDSIRSKTSSTSGLVNRTDDFQPTKVLSPSNEARNLSSSANKSTFVGSKLRSQSIASPVSVSPPLGQVQRISNPYRVSTPTVAGALNSWLETSLDSINSSVRTNASLGGSASPSRFAASKDTKSPSIGSRMWTEQKVSPLAAVPTLVPIEPQQVPNPSGTSASQVFMSLANRKPPHTSSGIVNFEECIPLSQVVLEDSDSDLEADLGVSRLSVSVRPESPKWTMQDWSYYTIINVSDEQYGITLQQSLELQASTLWDGKRNEENPVLSLKSRGLLETTTVDWICLYLQQLVYHSPNHREQVFITLPSRNQALLLQGPASGYDLWLGETPPDRILLPIIDPTAVHYYLYHVVFNKGSNSGPPANFYYIDSLGRAGTESIQAERNHKALLLIQYILRRCKGVESWDTETVGWYQGCPPNFRQAPGSVDCGLFVCQALSAVSLDQCSALETPLQATVVRNRLIWLMTGLGSGEFTLGARDGPPAWLLPLHTVQHRFSPSSNGPSDCPGPLISLADVYPVHHKRFWDLPDAPLASGVRSHELCQSKSPLSSTVSAPRRSFLGPKEKRPNPFLRHTQAQSSTSPKGAGVNPFRKRAKILPLPRAGSLATESSGRMTPALNHNEAATEPYQSHAEVGTHSPPDKVSQRGYEDKDRSNAAGPSHSSQGSVEMTSSNVFLTPVPDSRPNRTLRQTFLARSSTADSADLMGRLIIQRPAPASSSISGWTYVFGRQQPYQFPEPQGGRWADFFQDLSRATTRHPDGLLYGTKKRKVEDVLKFTVTQPKSRGGLEEIGPGVIGYQRPDGSHDHDPTHGMSILEFCLYVENLPDTEAQNRAVLTGTKPDGTPIVLNWLKDSIVLELHWLVAQMDVDSLSVTVRQPEFTMIVNVCAWPDHKRTLTTNNGLKIIHDGKPRPLSHFINFCFALMGNNNQFRVLVFVPGVKTRIEGGRYVTIAETDILRQWYDGIFLPAFKEVFRTLPPNMRAAYIQLQQELPDSYQSAADLSIGPGQRGKTPKLTAISPEIMNMIVPVMRRIVDNNDRFKPLRGFFFHIVGMNLKTSAQGIPGREADNLIQNAFNSHSVLNYNKVNPQDVVIDVGYEFMVDPDQLPDNLRHLTLLWNFSEALPIIAPKWRAPRVDRYLGSEVVAGGRSVAVSQARHSGLINSQFYHKDKNQTFGHSDRSKGTSYTLAQAMSNAPQFQTDMKHLKRAWEDVNSYGGRWDTGGTVFAERILWERTGEDAALNPLFMPFTDCLTRGQVAHRSAHVARIKETFRRNYVQIIERTQSLPPRVREQKDARAMVATLSHLIKSLVKRPDDQSTSRKMVAGLQMSTRSENYGFLSVFPDAVSVDMTRLDLDYVPDEALAILNYWQRKGPAGARIKTSFAKGTRSAQRQPVPEADDQLMTCTEEATESEEYSSDSSHASDPDDDWTEDDEDWIKRFLEGRFALHLWTNFPGRRSQVSHRLLEQPFRNDLWEEIARLEVRKQPLTRPANAFEEKIGIFFPPNWRTSSNEPQWKSYQVSILNRLRDRAKLRAGQDSDMYNTRMREAILRCFRTWHFLPCPQKRMIWGSSGTGDSKEYRVANNPQVMADGH